MIAPGLDDERRRRDAFRDARAQMLRAGEPGSDRRDEHRAAGQAMYAAAIAAAGDVEPLIAEVDRLYGWLLEIARADQPKPDAVDAAKDRPPTVRYLASVARRALDLPEPTTTREATS